MAALDLGRTLAPLERRVLGCLIEKELSTPDGYPLTLNSLLAACNQTTNRDPVLQVGPGEVEEALRALMADVLAWKERGPRTLRWKHALDGKLGLDAAGKAVVAELLLRGAQTPGELRSRTARMHPFGALEEVEEILADLASRRLAEELERLPGQKERRWRETLDGTGAPVAESADTATPAAAPRSGGLTDRLAALERQVEELSERLERLENR